MGSAEIQKYFLQKLLNFNAFFFFLNWIIFPIRANMIMQWHVNVKYYSQGLI